MLRSALTVWFPRETWMVPPLGVLLPPELVWPVTMRSGSLEPWTLLEALATSSTRVRTRFLPTAVVTVGPFL